MIVPRVRLCLAGAALAVASACSFHSVASRWNGRVGADGEPVFVRRTTNIGVNLLVVVPVFGTITLDEMIDESTGEIARLGSDRVRVIESASENYWHGFPPFTWIITPVITELAVEYRPSQQELDEVTKNDAGAEPTGDDQPEGSGGGPPDQDQNR